MTQPRDFWTPEQDAKLLAMRACTPPLSFSAVAAVLKRSRSACLGRAYRLALPELHPRRRPRPKVYAPRAPKDLEKSLVQPHAKRPKKRAADLPDRRYRPSWA